MNRRSRSRRNTGRNNLVIWLVVGALMLSIHSDLIAAFCLIPAAASGWLWFKQSKNNNILK